MNPCDLLDVYLDGTLTGTERTEFDVHLRTCENCAVRAATWQQIAASFVDTWETAESVHLRGPRDEDIAALLDRAASNTSPVAGGHRYGRLLLWGGLAAAVLVGISTLWLNLRSSEVTPPLRTPSVAKSVHKNADTAQDVASNAATAVLPHWHTGEASREIAFQSDRMRLAAHSAVAVVSQGRDTVLALHDGEVTFHVAKRTEGSFSVMAGPVRVVVVGTVFTVAELNDEVQVSVREGTVRVLSEKHEWTISKGESVRVKRSDGGATSSERPPKAEETNVQDRSQLRSPNDGASDAPREKSSASMSLAEIRSLVAAGALGDAKTHMEKYLKAYPADVDGWLLRSTIHKKEGNPTRALKDYTHIIDSLKGGGAVRARYLAGELCRRELKNPSCAVKYYSMYLSSDTGAPFWAEAAYYKAESLVALHRTAEAELLLRDIIQRYGRLPIAERAQKLLDSLHP